jgi:hypothetical protein
VLSSAIRADIRLLPRGVATAQRNVGRMRFAPIAIAAALSVAVCACAAQPTYRQPSSINDTLSITLPSGFSRQSDLANVISNAATDASSRKGVAGSVNVENRLPAPGAATPTPSGDAYLAALRDGQTHAAEIAKATGITLGRITSVREERNFPNYPSQTVMIVLEIDYGTTLVVYGSAPIKPTSYYGFAPNSMSVMILGQGQNASDARASADAFEAAIRTAVARFGIAPSQIKVQAGSVTAVSYPQ